MIKYIILCGQMLQLISGYEFENEIIQNTTVIIQLVGSGINPIYQVDGQR